MARLPGRYAPAPAAVQIPISTPAHWPAGRPIRCARHHLPGERWPSWPNRRMSHSLNSSQKCIPFLQLFAVAPPDAAHGFQPALQIDPHGANGDSTLLGNLLVAKLLKKEVRKNL